VKKTDPDEKVGVICKVNDRFQVVEYSEISQKTRNLRDAEDELTYNAGNICNHYLHTDFLAELCKLVDLNLKWS
jgi:UDP-N-acetylglucosamine/UDP-N-acetylgalactosamine diphosphorylase